MTRSTPSHQHNANYELSAAAALRTLRSIVYREWELFEAPMAAMDLEEDGPVVPLFSAVPLPAPSEGVGNWYLNEVPPEWQEGPWAGDWSANSIPA